VPAGKAQEPCGDLFAHTLCLIGRQHGNVTEVGAITAVTRAAARTNEQARIERKDAEQAVAENQREIGSRLVAERRGTADISFQSIRARSSVQVIGMHIAFH
jgi:hypothetical protein